MLDLRAVYINGDWDAFQKYRIKDERRKLYPYLPHHAPKNPESCIAEGELHPKQFPSPDVHRDWVTRRSPVAG